jgi:hypothetical protein
VHTALRARRVAAVVIGAACFGFLMAAIKGQGAFAFDGEFAARLTTP